MPILWIPFEPWAAWKMAPQVTIHRETLPQQTHKKSPSLWPVTTQLNPPPTPEWTDIFRVAPTRLTWTESWFTWKCSSRGWAYLVLEWLCLQRSSLLSEAPWAPPSGTGQFYRHQCSLDHKEHELGDNSVGSQHLPNLHKPSSHIENSS